MAKRTCSIEGCANRHHARGFCSTHYSRWFIHGDPTAHERKVGGRPCSVDGCERPVASWGWCNPHYKRWRKHGDPLAGRITDDDWDRFWANVDVGHPLGCWLWTAGTDTDGYGVFFRRGQRTKAPREAYELLIGRMPDGTVPDHLCRNPPCVNPDHLEPVTSGENTIRSPASVAGKNVRKTHCSNGHPLSGDNLVRSAPNRQCRACKNERNRAYKARRRAA